MIFLVYTIENDDSIRERLGLAEYSYFFVMKRFLPLLKALGRVEVLQDLAQVDNKLAVFAAQGEKVALFSFAPPHRTPVGLACPTFVVFAWEYSTIPHESWGSDARQNWAVVLGSVTGAITHSNFALNAARATLGRDYALTSLPAPLWDSYSKLYRQRVDLAASWVLKINKGAVIDSFAPGLSQPTSTPTAVQKLRIRLRGIVYVSVFNPNDTRKNWFDLLSAFCLAFRDNPNVTLLMKLVYCDAEQACNQVWEKIRSLTPFQCRVIAIQGFLEEKTYRKLIAKSTYIVNSSHGEGQCLPLMEFMSAGKPAIAPNHTAMADYLNDENAFIVKSSEEWTCWAHDPRRALRAFRYRIDWGSLRDAYIRSYQVALCEPDVYLRMSRSASVALGEHNGKKVILEGLRAFLDQQNLLSANNFLLRSRATSRLFLSERIKCWFARF